MPPSTLHSGFLLGLACVFAYALWSSWTPAGFEAKLVGLNKRFARAVGISIPSTIIVVMVISGLVAGLGGASHALGQVHKFSDGFSAGYGFTGMAVALLARNSALGIVFGAILFGALASAGTTIQLVFRYSSGYRQCDRGHSHDLCRGGTRQADLVAQGEKTMTLAAQILATTIILTTPILLAAIGGLVNRQGGIVNIALEAKMIAGAFIAIVVSSATGSWLLAVFASAALGGAIGYVFSLTITRANANMIIAGLGLNILVAGLLGFLLSRVYGTSGTLRLPDVHLLPKNISRERVGRAVDRAGAGST